MSEQPVIEMRGVHKSFGKHAVLKGVDLIVPRGQTVAIFVAVGATCRDFQGHLEDFWRSRPLSVTRWFMVKYIVGLMVVFAGGLLPLGVEYLVNRKAPAIVSLLFWLPFLWVAVYSVGFLAGCLMRRAAHAATLSVAAILLLYFMLMILPPVAWVEAALNTNGYYGWKYGVDWGIWWYFRGGAVLLVFAAALGAATLIAVRRGWRVETGRGMLYGSIGTTFLLLIIAAGLQLGTNLPVLYQTDLPNHERAILVRCDGRTGFVLSCQPGTADAHYFYRPIKLTANGIEFGNSSPIGSAYLGYRNTSAWSQSHPQIQWQVTDYTDIKTGWELCELLGQHLDHDGRNWPLRLWENMDSSSGFKKISLYPLGDRLYVMGTRLVTVDISEPDNPRVILDRPFSPFFGHGDLSDSGELQVDLPPIPEFTPRQRLDAAFHTSYWGASAAMDGDVLCVNRGGRLLAFRLTKLTDRIAEFAPIAEHTHILQRVFGLFDYRSDLQLVNGYLYQGASHVDMYSGPYRPARFNPRATVFDMRAADPVAAVGHFTAPGADIICPLPDGRALVAGTKIWIVGPPPRR